MRLIKSKKLKNAVCCFSGSGGCSFSHELNSEHNKRILREHELDNLSRKELCTLLLQSDNQILPPVSIYINICIFSFFLNNLLVFFMLPITDMPRLQQWTWNVPGWLWL